MASRIDALEYDKRYAIYEPRQGRKVPAYVIGKDWNSRGEYIAETDKKPRGRGRAVLAIIGVGTNIEATEEQAKNYTDARHIALHAIVDQLGQDAALDAMLFPADGWTARILTDGEYSSLVPWEEYEAEVSAKVIEEDQKRRTYRKLRTHMLNAIRIRDSQITLGGAPVAPPAPVQKVGGVSNAELAKEQRKLARIKQQIAELEPKALELTEVSNYQRAIHTTEDFLVNASPERFAVRANGAVGVAEDTNLLAHDLVLQLATLLQDEPRTISARRQHAETSRAKEAMWERWRSGTDGNGYDWLGGEDQDPHHIIDVLLGLLIDRGWRPTEPTAA
jgi:hypothetical protein